MIQLFRAMKDTSAGLPDTGASARTLGARPGIDVPARNPGDLVQPGEGGVSVSPDDLLNLPAFRRPPEHQGTGKDPLWAITDADLGPDLTYRADPVNPAHGFIEPARPMTLAEYQHALEQTKDRWQKV
jgi:hypothetical protein